MALSAYCVAEVRPGSGSDTNGGLFDNSVASPGTDYSQQNSAQVAYTDLVIGATNTQLTSAANPFNSTSPGNTIWITSGSGFTTGPYTVKSVSGTTATMDRAVGTASSTGGHGNLGGAWATLANVTGASPITVGGNIVWIKATASLTITSTLTFETSGGTFLRLSIRGYTTTRGDGVNATITTSTNSVNAITLQAVAGIEFMWLNFTCTAGTPGYGVNCTSANSAAITFQNCNFSGWNIGIFANFAVNWTIYGLYMIECKISACTSHGIISSGFTNLLGCWLHANTGDGIQINSSQTGSGLVAIGCVSDGNGGKGLNDQNTAASRSVTIFGCDLYNNTGDGLTENGGSAVMILALINTIPYNNGGYGINAASIGAGAAPASVNIQRSLAFGSNTSGSRSSGVPAGVNDVSLTTNPWNSPSTGDFSLNTSGGGGGACAPPAGWESAIV